MNFRKKDAEVNNVENTHINIRKKMFNYVLCQTYQLLINIVMR